MALKIAVHYILVFLFTTLAYGIAAVIHSESCDPFRDNIQHHTNHFLCGYICRFILF